MPRQIQDQNRQKVYFLLFADDIKQYDKEILKNKNKLKASCIFKTANSLSALFWATEYLLSPS